MPDTMDGLSMDLERTNMDKLRAVFPECFAEGKLDIDKLLSLCADCLKLAQKRSTGTLRPCPGESVGWDTTRNLYIEGDNLEVLKLLQTTYFRKVKMIYIDPPYNTGNDFVYADDFADPMARYKEVTQQTTKSNPETMGRFHTKWLNMMYPRLRLAANLLRDDGVIFISIDDGEVTNMRRLCDETFGEENFVAQIIWQKVYSPRMDVQGFSNSHDYVLCYVKSSVENIRQEAFTQNGTHFNFIDSNNGKKYRRRSIRKEGSHSTRSERPKLWFPLTAPDGTEVYPIKPDGTEGCWRWSMDTYIENNQQGLVEWVNTENGWQAYAKQYYDADAVKPPETLWLHQEVGHNHSASEELKKLLEGKVFDSPKPKELIAKMLKLTTYYDRDDIILDFFSGSATTAHAVMQLNAEDGGNRQFILVQLPEVCDEKSEAYKAGYKNICEIGKARIRRAGAKILAEAETQHQQLQLVEEEKPLPNVGFRVFKLDTTNLKTWDATPIEDGQVEILYDRMNQMVQQVKPERTDMDMVCEVMLKLGVPLTYPITTTDINGKTAYSVGEDALLLVCLAPDVTPEDVEAMADYAPGRVVIARESFADDTAMANAYYILRDRKIDLKLV